MIHSALWTRVVEEVSPISQYDRNDRTVTLLTGRYRHIIEVTSQPFPTLGVSSQSEVGISHVFHMSPAPKPSL
jgi:hypothetical protein